MITIYKIQCKNTDITDIYIGSSLNYEQRQQKHKTDCNNINNPNYNIKLYKFIRIMEGL